MKDMQLPPVVLQTRTSIGDVSHVLVEGHDTTILEQEQIRVSPRCTEDLLHLDDGQAVIVTQRRIKDIPPAVDGILRANAAGVLTWVWHKGLDGCKQLVDEGGWRERKRQVDETWIDTFRYRTEGETATGTRPGLRPPQIGALHAIGAHWSLSKQPGTIVMPTGTGKTETMIAALVEFVGGPLLVVVPSRVLRDQTANKFATLGLLRRLGVIDPHTLYPIVGIIRKRPRSQAELSFIAGCHVVVGTMGALGQGEAEPLGPFFAEHVKALFVDEAHHVPAKTWRGFRENFTKKGILQFTATPFRRDGELVDGLVLYSYPLRTAQRDGYFKQIRFNPVFEIDAEESDRAIAEAAIAQLKEDLSAGRNHLLMARCKSTDRANVLCGLYETLAPEFKPAVVHYEVAGGEKVVEEFRAGERRIVVCVDMLGEGFDLPQLKIAALHDAHRSLAVILQFTGRFTRAGGEELGDATVIGNVANSEVSHALDRLYSEDADWNLLLSEFSSDAIRRHQELVDFLRKAEALGDEEDVDSLEISPQLLKPVFSTVAYKVGRFTPETFHHGIAPSTQVQRAWLHRETDTLFFVTRAEPSLKWTRSRDLKDRQWDLFIAHHDRKAGLLLIHSSDKSSTHEAIAKAVSGDDATLLKGDVVFRTLGRVNRLQFQSIGLKKHGRRNLRYAMYTGADVELALGLAERAGSEKSNLFGFGWAGGGPVSIGCSQKGRVWSRSQGSVPEFVEWAEATGRKLLDEAIDTRDILKNVLIPSEVEEVPDSTVLSIDWPVEILRQSEANVVLMSGGAETAISLCSLSSAAERESQSSLLFSVESDELKENLRLEVGGERGFIVHHVKGDALQISVGRIGPLPLAQYLSDYPPLIRFVDMSELDGNLLVTVRDMPAPELPSERFEVWDWSGVDVTRESLWKDGAERPESIQGEVARHFIGGGFKVVFDDDAPGEAADLVCLKEEEESIRLALVHCKFSAGATAGERVRDVVEVCAQAVRSSKWKWRFRELCRHLLVRDRKLQKPYRASRFLAGNAKKLNQLLAMSRFKEVRAEVVVVQPGLSRSRQTPDQNSVLGAAHSFLKQTVDCDLDVICSE